MIGPCRGLEDALVALAGIQLPVELHLRGEALPSFEGELRALTAELGIVEGMHLWAPAPLEEPVALAQRHFIGLALEQQVSRNRQVCVTDKLFTSLVAGLAVASADAWLLREPGALERTKKLSCRAAGELFCRELERGRLVSYLTRPAAAASAALPGPRA